MSGPLNSWFPMYAGSFCEFSETLSISPVDLITFTFEDPYLYVIDAGKNFPGPLAGFIYIYDCSDPNGIVLVSTTSTPVFSGPRHPRVYGNYLYLPYSRPNTPAQATTAGVPGQTPQLSIWDVSDRENPVQVGAVNLDYSTAAGKFAQPQGSVIKIGDYAYIVLNGTADYNVVQINVSNPASPVIGTEYRYDASLQAEWIEEYGSYVVIAGSRGNRAAVVAVTTSPFPSSGGSFVSPVQANVSIPEEINRFSINSVTGFLYAPLQPANDIQAVDITDPTSITLADRVTGPAQNSIPSPIVAIAGNERVYSGTNDLIIWDTSVPGTPSVAGTLDTDSAPTDMCRVQNECHGFIYSSFTGNEIHLLGTAPLS